MNLVLDPITGSPGFKGAGFQQFLIDEDAPSGDKLVCVIYGRTKAVLRERAAMIVDAVKKASR